jgi:hypothetical protein
MSTDGLLHESAARGNCRSSRRHEMVVTDDASQTDIVLKLFQKVGAHLPNGGGKPAGEGRIDCGPTALMAARRAATNVPLRSLEVASPLLVDAAPAWQPGAAAGSDLLRRPGR